MIYHKLKMPQKNLQNTISNIYTIGNWTYNMGLNLRIINSLVKTTVAYSYPPWTYPAYFCRVTPLILGTFPAYFEDLINKNVVGDKVLYSVNR